MNQNENEPKHLQCSCGHYVFPIREELDWWWCGACGRLAAVFEDEIECYFIPNARLKGVSWEDERKEEAKPLLLSHLPVDLIKKQPHPDDVDGESVWKLVMADMKAREEFGHAKYGTFLHANDGRDSLIDAYQEALDLVVYLRKAIEERPK